MAFEPKNHRADVELAWWERDDLEPDSFEAWGPAPARVTGDEAPELAEIRSRLGESALAPGRVSLTDLDARRAARHRAGESSRGRRFDAQWARAHPEAARVIGRASPRQRPPLPAAILRQIVGHADAPPERSVVARAAERFGRSHGVAMAPSIRADWERRLGVVLDEVFVHTDDAAAEAAELLEARAFTVGNHVFFGAGQYAPDSRDGDRLLAHELSHVSQNARRATPPAAGVSRPGDDVETDAERIASRAERAPARRPLSGAPFGAAGPGAVESVAEAAAIFRETLGDLNEEDSELILFMRHRRSSVDLFVSLTPDQLTRFTEDRELANRLARDVEATFTPDGVELLESAAFLSSTAVGRRVRADLDTWLGGGGLPTVTEHLAARAAALASLALIFDLETELEGHGVEPGTIDWGAVAIDLINDPPAEAATLVEASFNDRYHLFLRAVANEAPSRPEVVEPATPPLNLRDLIYDYALSLEPEAYGGDAPDLYSEAFLTHWLVELNQLDYVPDSFDLTAAAPSSRDDVDAERERVIADFIDGYAPDIAVQYILDDWTLSNQSQEGYLEGLDIDAMREDIIAHLASEFMKMAREDAEWSRVLRFQAHEEARFRLLAMIYGAGLNMEQANRELFARLILTPINDLEHWEFEIGKDPAAFYTQASQLAEACHGILSAVDSNADIGEALASATFPEEGNVGAFVAFLDLLTHMKAYKDLVDTQEQEAVEHFRENIEIRFDDIAEVVRTAYDRAAEFIENEYIPKVKEIALAMVTANRDELQDWLDNWDTKTPRLIAQYRIAGWALGDLAGKLESGEVLAAQLNGRTVTIDDLETLRDAQKAMEGLADRLESEEGADEKKEELQEAVDAFDDVVENIEDGDYEPYNFGHEVHRRAREELGIGEFPDHATFGMVFAGLAHAPINPFAAKAIASWQFVERADDAFLEVALLVAAGIVTVASFAIPGAPGLVIGAIDIGIAVGMGVHGVIEANRVLDLALLDPNLELQGISVERAREAVSNAWVGLALAILIPVGIAAFAGAMILLRARGASSLRNLAHLQRAIDADPVAVERLLRLVEDPAKLDGLLGVAGDVATLDRMVGHVGDITKLENLLDVFEAERLAGLLDAGGNADTLLRIADRVPDATTLDNLLVTYGDDAFLLDSHLATLGDDSAAAGRLEALLDTTGGVAELDHLFLFCDDMAQLEGIVNHLDDVNVVTTLLEQTGSGARVVDLIDHLGDAAEITRFLDGLGDADDVLHFMPLVEANPVAAISFARSLETSPGLAVRMVRAAGNDVVAKVVPEGSGMVRIGGELPIAPAKLDTFTAEELETLVRICDDIDNAPAADLRIFEGNPHRVVFPSRARAQVDPWVAEVLADLGIAADAPEAAIFQNMTDADRAALLHLSSRDSRVGRFRTQATRWALGKNPADVKEFGALTEFYGGEVRRLGDERAAAITARVETAVAGGADRATAFRRETGKSFADGGLGAALPHLEGRGARRRLEEFAIGKMDEAATTASGEATTVGATRADAAWDAVTGEMTGANAPGRIDMGGGLDDAAVADAVRDQASSLNFGREDTAAYHAHVHEREGVARPPGSSELEHYLGSARDVIENGAGTTRVNQDGTRSVTFEGATGTAIVHVDHTGRATIATFMPRDPTP